MVDPPPTKFYCRKALIGYDREPQASAKRGLWELGVEVVEFDDPLDIPGFSDLSPDVGIAGFISDVQRGLQVLGGPADLG